MIVAVFEIVTVISCEMLGCRSACSGDTSTRTSAPQLQVLLDGAPGDHGDQRGLLILARRGHGDAVAAWLQVGQPVAAVGAVRRRGPALLAVGRGDRRAGERPGAAADRAGDAA